MRQCFEPELSLLFSHFETPSQGRSTALCTHPVFLLSVLQIKKKIHYRLLHRNFFPIKKQRLVTDVQTNLIWIRATAKSIKMERKGWRYRSTVGRVRSVHEALVQSSAIKQKEDGGQNV